MINIEPSVKCQSQPTSEIVSRSSSPPASLPPPSPPHGMKHAALPGLPFFVLCSCLGFCLFILATSSFDLQVSVGNAAITTGLVKIKFAWGIHIDTCHTKYGALLRHSAISSQAFRLPSNASGAPAAEKRLPCGPICHALPFRAGTLAIIAENGLGMPVNVHTRISSAEIGFFTHLFAYVALISRW